MTLPIDQRSIRQALGNLEISPQVEPNETINIDRVYFPNGHRGVLDAKRQLVVGNRGMGKSFWTHALLNPDVLKHVADAYSFPTLSRTKVVLGFNGSAKLSPSTPSIHEIQQAFESGENPEVIWRAVLLRAITSVQTSTGKAHLAEDIQRLKLKPLVYAEELTAADEANGDSYVLILFDALDRLSQDWPTIRALTRGLLITILGLQSFRSVRAKVFMRVDQFSDSELFHFPDSSKLRNDHVNLGWEAHELYGLLLFEISRQEAAELTLKNLATQLGASSALPIAGKTAVDLGKQQALISGITGEFMGTNAKLGRVYSWVPLHLSDAKNNCSPRTFLTAWKTAAEHNPAPQTQAVDRLGLSEGVRRASKVRMTELSEDFPWIPLALRPLRGEFVPMEQSHLIQLWKQDEVVKQILDKSQQDRFLAPIGMDLNGTPEALLKTMTSVAVMEERANGKINVPDIFRVEAGVLRKGGVAVPRKN
jgi:hypothetical protein